MLRKKLTKIINKTIMGVLLTITLVGGIAGNVSAKENYSIPPAPEPEVIIEVSNSNQPVVILDAGHGLPKDPGAIGIDGKTKESDLNFDLTMKTKKELEARGVKVLLTRTDKNQFKTLQERINYAMSHNESDAYVSIHHNSHNKETAMGAQIHYDYYNSNGEKLAEKLHKPLADAVQTQDRGKIKSNFYTRNITNQPAVIVETSFISNKNDLEKAKANQDQIAKALAQSILEYVQTR